MSTELDVCFAVESMHLIYEMYLWHCVKLLGRVFLYCSTMPGETFTETEVTFIEIPETQK